MDHIARRQCTGETVMRIYIAGPMSGLPEFNYPLFHLAAKHLRDQGYHVENPAENPPPPCGSWLGYMRMSIAQLSTCDAVYFLPNWDRSKGARTEFDLAVSLGLERHYFGPDFGKNHAQLPQNLDSDDDSLHDDDGELCDRCNGDGRDPLTDYLLPCPSCNGGDATCIHIRLD